MLVGEVQKQRVEAVAADEPPNSPTTIGTCVDKGARTLLQHDDW